MSKRGFLAFTRKWDTFLCGWSWSWRVSSNKPVWTSLVLPGKLLLNKTQLPLLASQLTCSIHSPSWERGLLPHCWIQHCVFVCMCVRVRIQMEEPHDDQFTKARLSSRLISPCWSGPWPARCNEQCRSQTHSCLQSWCQNWPADGRRREGKGLHHKKCQSDLECAISAGGEAVPGTWWRKEGVRYMAAGLGEATPPAGPRWTGHPPGSRGSSWQQSVTHTKPHSAEK